MICLKNKYNDIIVNRKGTGNESFMITTDILLETQPNSYYKVIKNGLEINDKNSEKSKNIKISEPKYLEFSGLWLSEYKINIENNDANILGGFSKFEIDLDEMFIPIQEATIENLMYYFP